MYPFHLTCNLIDGLWHILHIRFFKLYIKLEERNYMEKLIKWRNLSQSAINGLKTKASLCICHIVLKKKKNVSAVLCNHRHKCLFPFGAPPPAKYLYHS